MNDRDRRRCKCPTVTFVLPDGERIEGVERPEPDCPVHGLPEGCDWPPGHPLRRHAKVIEKETGQLFTHQEAHKALRKPGELGVDGAEYRRRFRNETPRETEARLFRETTAT